MHKKITLIVGLLALLSIPHVTSAQSYDYISASDFFSNFNPRSAKQIVAERQARDAARSDAAYAALNAPEETMHASPGEPVLETNSEVNTLSILGVDPATVAALGRLEQQRADNELRAQALSLLGGNLSLHSGADLGGGTGKGGDTGKGGTGKGGTPGFLPTNNNGLSNTGVSTYIVFALLSIAAVTTLSVLHRKQTAFVA